MNWTVLTFGLAALLTGCAAGDSPETYCNNKVPAEQWGYRIGDDDSAAHAHCIERATELRRTEPKDYECSSKCWALAAKHPLESESGAQWGYGPPPDSRLGRGELCEEHECGKYISTRE